MVFCGIRVFTDTNEYEGMSTYTGEIDDLEQDISDKDDELDDKDDELADKDDELDDKDAEIA